MKATLTFDLPDDADAFADAQAGTRYKLALDSIWQEVFRPHYKHGYADAALDQLAGTEAGGQLIDLLAERYQQVLRQYNVQDS